MKKILMIDEVLALARLSQVAFDKPIKYMDDTDAVDWPHESPDSWYHLN
ncbi:hypothetical protein [Klebsiella pneumoniae]|nr:hypothetical protein [Klebsiella pneumoniae]